MDENILDRLSASQYEFCVMETVALCFNLPNWISISLRYLCAYGSTRPQRMCESVLKLESK